MTSLLPNGNGSGKRRRLGRHRGLSANQASIPDGWHLAVIHNPGKVDDHPGRAASCAPGRMSLKEWPGGREYQPTR